MTKTKTIQNDKKIAHEPKEKPEKKHAVEHDLYVEGIGRRKTSIARVRIYPNAPKNEKHFSVNNVDFEKYSGSAEFKKMILDPINKLGTEINKMTASVYGGGVSSQAEAIRLGVARALVKFDESFRKKLRVFGYLTRDPRAVERKKYGLKKARKAPQWSKR